MMAAKRARAKATNLVEVAPAPGSVEREDNRNDTPSTRRRSSFVSPVNSNYDFDQQLEQSRNAATGSADDFDKLLNQKTLSPASTMRRASMQNKKAHMEKLANIGEAYLPEHLRNQDDLTEARDLADQAKEAAALKAAQEDFERIKAELSVKAKAVQDKMKHVIRPSGRWMRTWNMVIALFLLFTAVITPYEVSFLETKLDILFFINQLVTIGFVVDIDVNFHLAYIEKRTLKLVTDPGTIKKNYLSSWFVIDVISTIPYDILALVMDNGAGSKLKIIRILKLLKLTRLLRMVKSMRIFKTLQSKLHLSARTSDLLKVLIMVLTSLHWCACLWRLIPELEENPEHDWMRLLYDNGDLKNCTLTRVAEGEDEAMKVTCDPYLLYVICLEFATMIMAMGYPPWANAYGIPTETERWVGLCMLFFASVLYTYAIGFCCAVLSTRNAAVEYYQNQADLLMQYMKEGHFPMNSRFRISEYFRQSKQCVNCKYFKQELTSFLPASLQSDTAAASQHWIRLIPFFRVQEPEETRSLLMHLSRVIQYAAIPEGEHLYQKDESARCMFVLRRGACRVGTSVKMRGECFGMEFLLRDSIRQYAAQAITFMDVAVLTRDALMGMIGKYKVLFPETRQLLRREIRRLAIFQTMRQIGTAAMVIKMAKAKGSWKPMTPEQLYDVRGMYRLRSKEVKAARKKAAAEERVSQALIAQARKDFKIEQKAEAKAKAKQERDEKQELKRLQKEEGLALDSDEEGGDDEYDDDSYSDEEEDTAGGEREEVITCPASEVPGAGACADTCRLCHGSQLWFVPVPEPVEETEEDKKEGAPVDGKGAKDGEDGTNEKGKGETGEEAEEEKRKEPVTEEEKQAEKTRLEMVDAVDTLLFWAPVAAVRQKRKLHERVESTGRAVPEEAFWTRFSFEDEERPPHAQFFMNELRDPTLGHLDSKRPPIDYERLSDHAVHETRYWKIDFGRGLDERLSRVRSTCQNRTDEQLETMRQKIARHFDSYDQEMLQTDATLGKIYSDVSVATGKLAPAPEDP
jgi:potassium voltage-gated channel Eag-related subfamily H protein 7